VVPNLAVPAFQLYTERGPDMKTRFLSASLVCFALLLFAAPVWAHHSFAAEYDNQKPVTHKGVVTKIDWMNPHVYIYIDEKSEDGKVVNWGFEGYPPNTLRRVGLSREMLKVGDSVSVTGWVAKDGTARFAGREITWPDGRKFFVGPPAN
jgi:hypothetical protein